MSIAVLTLAAAQAQADITIVSWSALKSALQNKDNDGETIMLTRDINAPNTGEKILTISQDITLDLNGYTLTGNGRSEVIRIEECGYLTLIDDSAAGTGLVTGGSDHIVYVAEEGAFMMEGGTIAGNSPADINSSCGGGVFVDGDGSFEMSGGAIANNTAAYGGGVYVHCNGSFYMSGGTIAGNTATYSGGGVYIGRAENDCDVGAVFEMSGGVITGNFAETGGGVLVEEGWSEEVYDDADETYYENTYESGSFSMAGGIITGNGASGNGGGVYTAVEDAIFLSDAPVISGNTNLMNDASNVYLDTWYGLYVSKLSAGASIGVTPYAAPSAGNPVAISYYLDDEGDSAYFFSDIPDCSATVVNGELCLVYGSEPAFPAYLAGADDVVKSNYVAWAALYGPDTASEYEEEFLLNIDPATAIPPAASLLKIVSFAPTATGWRLGVESDVATLAAVSGTARVGNGYLSVLRAADPTASPTAWSSSTIPVSVASGLITVDVPTGATPLPFFKVKLSAVP